MQWIYGYDAGMVLPYRLADWTGAYAILLLVGAWSVSYTHLSFWGWIYLTDLSKNNGLLYFIVDYLSLYIDDIDFRHKILSLIHI